MYFHKPNTPLSASLIYSSLVSTMMCNASFEPRATLYRPVDAPERPPYIPFKTSNKESWKATRVSPECRPIASSIDIISIYSSDFTLMELIR